MRPLALLPFGILAVGGGLAAGLVLGAGADEGDFVAEPEVVLRDDDGEFRTFTAEAAAARIESLESLLKRSSERRAAQTAAADEDALAAGPEGADAESLQPTPPLVRPDGRPYSPDELRALARGSKDPEVRRAAIVALRRVDTDAARDTLQAILADDETSPEMRLLTARVLANRPHRDHLPSELITALAEEEDPEIRRVLANGVSNLRERGVWMSEISTALGEEQDADVRRALLRAVARSSRDPAAREQLLAIAISPLAPPDERRTALNALTRGAPDKETVAQLRPLLDERDPAVRAQALRVLTGDRNMPLSTLQAGLRDSDAGVRAMALWRGMNHYGRYKRNKDAPKAVKAALAATSVRVTNLAKSDPDPGVRRAAISASRHLGKKERNAVLAAGRNDADLDVRMAAYAGSPRDVALSATDTFLGALSAPNARTRDYAYAQLRRLHGVRVPFQGIWNDEARNAAITKIRAEIRK